MPSYSTAYSGRKPMDEYNRIPCQCGEGTCFLEEDEAWSKKNHEEAMSKFMGFDLRKSFSLYYGRVDEKRSQ